MCQKYITSKYCIFKLNCSTFRYRLGAVQKMMDDIDGSVDEEKELKSELKKDIFRRKAQLTQVKNNVSSTPI